MDGRSETGHGESAIDEVFLRGFDQYRTHLELVYPFGVAWLLGILLELRLELFELLFDFDNGMAIRTDPEVLEAILSDRAADRLLPVLDELLWLLVLSILGMAVLAALATLVALAIAFLVVRDDQMGRNRSQIARARVAIRRLPAFFAATIVAGVLIGVGLVLLVAPGVYLAGKFALAGPAIVIDGHGPLDGLRTSWDAVSGQFVDVLGTLVLGGLALVLVGLVPLVGELLAVLVVLPVFALAIASLYVEMSTRPARE